MTIEPAELGTHAIVVRAPGFREVRRTCSVGPGRNCQVYAELNVLGVPVRIEANVAGAQLFIDGQPRGPVPWEGDLPAGSHSLEIRAEGYQTHTEQLRLQKSSRVRLIQVILGPAAMPVDETKRDKEAERADPLPCRSALRPSTSRPAGPGWPHSACAPG